MTSRIALGTDRGIGMGRLKFFAVAAAVVGLLAFSATAAATAVPPGWQSTQLQGQPATVVSCTSSSFCMAVGGEDAYTYNGRSWSKFTRADPLGWLTAVTCQSRSFCVAGDRHGKLLIYSGSSWDTPTQVLNGAVNSVSCPSRGYCIAASGRGTISSLNGSSWSPAKRVDSYGLKTSCWAAGQCIATDAHGRVLRLRRNKWSVPRQQDRGGGGFRGISCTSANFCAAIDHRGGLTFNGRAWHRASLRGNGTPLAISCGSSRFCTVAGSNTGGKSTNAYMWTLRSGKWKKAFAWGDYPSSSVSCDRSGFCASVNIGGEVMTRSQSRWKQQSSATTTGSAELMNVSCASSTLCMAGALNGDAFSWDGTSWGKATPVPGLPALQLITCGASEFCVASGGIWGGLSYYRSGNWVQATGFGKTAPTPLACTSSSFCTGFEYKSALNYNGSGWTTQKLPFEVAGDTQISCVSASFCVSMDQSGQLITFNGSTWARSTAAAPQWLGTNKAVGLDQVACSSPGFCLGPGVIYGKTEATFESAVFNGSAWSKPQRFLQLPLIGIPGSQDSLSCTVDNTCLYANAERHELLEYSAGKWSKGQPLDPAPSSTEQLSCTLSGFCAAIATTGGDVLWSPGPPGA